MTESFDKILMTLSAAVVYAPDNTPMFREIAYAGIPQCKINEEKTLSDTTLVTHPGYRKLVLLEER